MNRVAPPEGVIYQADVVGGVSGWWCRPAGALPGLAILHLHGGWFNWGSAHAYRHLVGHLALRAGACAFIADYRLAPEHPFPAALEDAHSCYEGLLGLTDKVAVTGDSAGGGLALGLLSLVVTRGELALPVAAAVLSPVTDLSLAGASWKTRSERDPYFTLAQVQALASAYLGEADPDNPIVSALHGNVAGLPPVSVHVGDDEVLLDDARRYAERAFSAGCDATLDIWKGMPHGFASHVGKLDAANRALDMIGAFLKSHLGNAPV